MNSPQLALAGFIAKRLERNGDFHGPAITGDHSLRLHHDIHAEVCARAFGHDPILLNAERVPAQHVGAALIVEGIQKHTHVIVAENFVAFRDCRAHLARFVVTMKRKVKKLRIVSDKGFGRS